MDKVPLLTTGLSGLVGSKFEALFQDKYVFDNLDISHSSRPIDITDFAAVQPIVGASSAQTLVHFAAFTDVTKAWEQRDDKTGIAYRVNVLGTENLVRACEKAGKHFVQISTAYVFDGKKQGLYTEDDAPSPIEWYGYTKAKAEEVVINSSGSSCVLRIDQPFRSDTQVRPDIVRRIASGLQAGTLPPQFTDHTFGPTFIDDFARVLDWVVSEKAQGVYHASSGESWTDFQFAQALQKAQQLPGDIRKGRLDDYLATLNRPYQRNTALDSSKLKVELPFEQLTIRKALELVEL